MAGRIRSFRSYSNQDSSLHADENDVRAVSKHLFIPPPGAVEVGQVLLSFLRAKLPWSVVESYLSSCVFELEDPDALSGPGSDFVKD